MRVSKQVMAENNSKIISAAARLFREKGIDDTSVAEVMGAAGLTHGGFYRHFKTKDDLVIAAIDKACKDLERRLEKAIAQQGAQQAIKEFVLRYLSEQHVISPGTGCPIAALSSEIDRKSKALQKAISHGTERLVSLLEQGVNASPSEKHSKAIGLLAVLVGALILARSAETGKTRDDILAAGRCLTTLYLN